MAEKKVTETSWTQKADVLVAIFVLCIIVMMVVPLPPLLIDILIGANIMLAMMTILTVMYIGKAIDFSVFPSLLLLSTVYRLALEVSSSRLILLGRGGEVGIINAFGSFVVGGNYVVGIIIFTILTVIQLLVIVRGTTRVSEVSARFTLDSMPGKQMAIDADLNAGYITEAEALKRRVEIRKEADFYGAMDGSAKFVQGDVIAAIVIIIINIIGGLVVGVIMRGEPLGDAIRAYTTYTIGCGLSAQIPAFLISVATGIIVSRAASDQSLGTDLTKQLTSQPPVLWITSGGLLLLAFTPLPKAPLLLLSGVSAMLGYIMSRTEKRKVVEEKEQAKKDELEKIKKPESVASLLMVDPMELEVGYGLIPFIDPEQGGDLLERITMLRRQSALEQGIIVPPIRIRDNVQIQPQTYIIKIRGVEVGRGVLKSEHYLAMKVKDDAPDIGGEETTEPTFGLPALWIGEEKKEYAAKEGYTVVDPPSVVATHLTEIIRRHSSELLGKQEVQTMVENIKEKYPTVVSELIPEHLTLGELQKVLQNLLKERVSIRNMVTILETLGDWAGKTKDATILTEKVRSALFRQITQQYQSPDGTLKVITIDPKLEEQIAISIQGDRVVLEPALVGRIMKELQDMIGKAGRDGFLPVILATGRTRPYLVKLIQPVMPMMGVLSYDEIATEAKVVSVGMIRV